MKFKDKFQTFMKGRYGVDELYKFLFEVYIVLFIINLFLRSNILNILELVIVIIIFYRFFSRKIYVRSKENAKFLKLKKNIIKPFLNIKRNISDKTHVYKKCPKCKTVLKLPLPSRRGIKHAVCPKCNNKVILFTFKKEKVKIIKNR